MQAMQISSSSKPVRLLLSFLATLVAFEANAAVSLDEAFRAALRKNETVAIVGQNVVVARERVEQAGGSILPSVTLNGQHQMQDRPSDPIARQFFPENATTINATLSQPLWRGLREFAAIRQQRGLVRAEEHSRLQAVLSLYQEVASKFISVLSYEQDLKNIHEQIVIYEKRASEVQSRTRTGESNTSELLTTQTTLASLRAENEVIKGQVSVARDQLQSLTGVDRNAQLADQAPAKSENVSALADYLKNIENRPDVKAARERTDAAKEGIGIARGAHWGIADISGNYYFVRPEGATKDMKWDLMLKLSFPIYEGGVTQSRVREAGAKSLQAELDLARTRRLADQEIRDAYENLRTRLAQAKALEKAVDLSERNAQVTQRDYRRGLVRSIDVQLALAEYRVTRRLLDQSRYGSRLEAIRLQIASSNVNPQTLEASK